eukprot:scaffold101400_cov30-Tisochrysis_lutea.AAC.2
MNSKTIKSILSSPICGHEPPPPASLALRSSIHRASPPAPLALAVGRAAGGNLNNLNKGWCKKRMCEVAQEFCFNG